MRVTVYKELEDLTKPDRQVGGRAVFNNDFPVNRTRDVVGPIPLPVQWLPRGRDSKLEQAIPRQAPPRPLPVKDEDALLVGKPIRRPRGGPIPSAFPCVWPNPRLHSIERVSQAKGHHRHDHGRSPHQRAGPPPTHARSPFRARRTLSRERPPDGPRQDPGRDSPARVREKSRRGRGGPGRRGGGRRPVPTPRHHPRIGGLRLRRPRARPRDRTHPKGGPKPSPPFRRKANPRKSFARSRPSATSPNASNARSAFTSRMPTTGRWPESTPIPSRKSNARCSSAARPP